MVMRIYGWEFLGLYHHPDKFGDHRNCDSEDVIFLICLVTLPVITLDKKNLSKQVVTTTCTLEKKFFCSWYVWRFVNRFFSDKVKRKKYTWFGWPFFRFPEKIRPNKNCLWEANLFLYMKIVSLIYQSINLSWKIVVQNTGYVYAYLCCGPKNISRL